MATAKGGKLYSLLFYRGFCLYILENKYDLAYINWHVSHLSKKHNSECLFHDIKQIW